MTKEEKQQILEKVKEWFRTVIIPNHLKNTNKLSDADILDINPFLVPYIAVFLTDELTPRSIAKAILYPRILGSSITTSFGQNLQKLITSLFESYGSLVTGIDIEFVDYIDNRKKYCQVKLGPNTINADDVVTIHNHFRNAKNLGKTNNVAVQQHDLVVGILYGEDGQESNHYKALRDEYDYTLLIGQDFWYRLSGDENFYRDLILSISEVAKEARGKEVIAEVEASLAKSLKIKRILGEQ